MKLLSLLLLVLTACTTAPKTFYLIDAENEKQSQSAVEKCRREALAFLKEKRLSTLQNISKRMREKRKSSDPLEGLDINCGDLKDQNILRNFTRSGFDSQLDLGKKECIFHPQTDHWLCMSFVDPFPRVLSQLITSTAALNEADVNLLKKMDDKSKDTHILDVLDRLHSETVALQLDVQIVPPELTTVSFTALRLTHEQNVLMEFLIRFAKDSPKNFDSLVINNKKNRAVISTVLKESEDAYLKWRKLQLDFTSARPMPPTFEVLREISLKLMSQLPPDPNFWFK